MKQKTVAESQTERVEIVMPLHLNGSDRLFGGQLALWIDDLAGIVAIRHSGKRIVTARIDSLVFHKPVMQGEIIVMIGKVTYVGRTSMEVRVDTYTETPDGAREQINTAYLVEVAIDDAGHATEVPRLICETIQEKLEYEAGRKRRAMRADMQKQIERIMLSESPSTSGAAIESEETQPDA